MNRIISGVMRYFDLSSEHPEAEEEAEGIAAEAKAKPRNPAERGKTFCDTVSRATN